jgi:hypothetical protein
MTYMNTTQGNTRSQEDKKGAKKNGDSKGSMDNKNGRNDAGKKTTDKGGSKW